MVSRGGSGGVREFEGGGSMRVRVWWEGVEHVDSDVFFIHAPKKTEPGAQQAPRPQWSV